MKVDRDMTNRGGVNRRLSLEEETVPQRVAPGCAAAKARKLDGDHRLEKKDR
jgi:hypothetical protein